MESLTAQLEALRSSRRTNPDWEAAYQEVLRTLDREVFLSQVIDVGAAFPDFMLPNAEGRFVSLSDHLARGPVILAFFRGEWCPFCRLTLSALTASLPAIEAAGASVLALTPETGGLALKMKDYHKAGFEVLADVDFGVGMMAGLVYKIPPLYRARLDPSGVAFPLRQGNTAWCLPVPATFILSQDGKVIWRFVDVDFSHRAEPEAMIAVLRGLVPS